MMTRRVRNPGWLARLLMPAFIHVQVFRSRQERLQLLGVNGGIKVRRVAEGKCSARPINTPHTVGRQLLVHSCRNTLDVRLSALAPN